MIGLSVISEIQFKDRIYHLIDSECSIKILYHEYGSWFVDIRWGDITILKWLSDFEIERIGIGDYTDTMIEIEGLFKDVLQ